jgi:hypothetical protein
MYAIPIAQKNFNPQCKLPYGLTCKHVMGAMEEFIGFIDFINGQLHMKQMPRLESFLMPANFSSMVGEFIHIGIEKHCPTLVKNKYHNGHPDLIPVGMFRGDAVQHSLEGIEIKASRYKKAWQGHNAEDCWLMVFVFESNRPSDKEKGIAFIPFKFVAVYGAQLTKNDWKFSGRSSTSRRTITASVIDSGYQKMTQNWIYRTD